MGLAAQEGARRSTCQGRAGDQKTRDRSVHQTGANRGGAKELKGASGGTGLRNSLASVEEGGEGGSVGPSQGRWTSDTGDLMPGRSSGDAGDLKLDGTSGDAG